jgi:proline iminopeptidase
MYAHVNGVNLFFDIDGGGVVPSELGVLDKPVIFVHHGGPGCDHTYFRPWLDQLTDIAQLVYVDHRGTGRSEHAPLETYTIEQMADDLEALRHHLGLGKITILGHSFGGMVAQVFALRHPASLDRLILSNTAPSSQFWEEAQAMADKTATEDQKEILNDLFEGTLSSQEEFDAWWAKCMPLYFHSPDQQVLDAMGRRMKGAVEVANYMMENEIPRYDVRSGLASVTVPTLVLAGAYDWVTPPTQSEQIRAGLPESEYVLFENSGHMPFIEENDLYLESVTKFMAS